jgi:DNA-binding transcriptional MerR regulator
MTAIGYDIEGLARRAGTTTRNLRAYQTAGLLPAPTRVGRRTRYEDEHLRRLALIQRLRARRYSLAAIRDLLRAWEEGQSLGQVLGLDRPSPTTWFDELFQLADLGVDRHALIPSLN